MHCLYLKCTLLLLAMSANGLIRMGPTASGRSCRRRRSPPRSRSGAIAQHRLLDEEPVANFVVEVKGRGRAAKRQLERAAEERYSWFMRKLLNLEQAEEERLARERIETWSQQRLLASGMALLNMRAHKRRHAFYGRPVLRLFIAKSSGTNYTTRLPFHRFGPGDLVLLSSSTITQLDGAIIERSPYYIDIALNQKNYIDSGTKTKWRLDQYYSTLSYQRMEAAIDAVTATSSGYFEARIGKLDRNRDEISPELKRIVVRSALDGATSWADLAAQPSAGLCRKAPSANTARGVIEEIAPTLDIFQKRAAAKALRARLSLIQGPPGTGKTKCAAALVAAAVRLRDIELNRGVRGELPIQAHNAAKKRALVCAASNVAADNLLERLLEYKDLKAIRLGNPASVRPNLRHATLDAMTQNDPDAITEILFQADVVVSSCIGAGGDLLAPFLATSSSHKKNSQITPILKFGLVLIDEAAQATEPQCLVPLATALGATQLILIGDPNQLPPVVLSLEARNALGTSLFQRLQDAGLQPHLLSRQYRMHPAINAFPSRQFYKNRVSTCPIIAENRLSQPPPLLQGLLSPELPILFLAVPNGQEQRGDHDSATASYFNLAEVDAVSAAVQALLAAGATPQDIGIVTPYAAQARAITQNLVANDSSANVIEVGTVDGFQGREKNIMLISAVRANKDSELGFLADARRLNVAITRPRQALIVFGHPNTLRADCHWCAFLDHCHNIGCARTFHEIDLLTQTST
uniref:RNA helicase n=1 Tax=Aureoumbra lagunensis TaxID=44058 RepID=A0A7S3JZD4_9STRA